MSALNETVWVRMIPVGLLSGWVVRGIHSRQEGESLVCAQEVHAPRFPVVCRNVWVVGGMTQKSSMSVWLCRSDVGGQILINYGREPVNGGSRIYGGICSILITNVDAHERTDEHNCNYFSSAAPSRGTGIDVMAW